LGFQTATPRQIAGKLRRIYCGRIGYEFMHINDPEQKIWLQRRIEGRQGSASRPKARRAILNKLIEAEGFEKFAANRFVGTKRFGLDGGEATIPGAGADHQARRPARRERDRAGHGPSRPAECAGQCDGQTLSPAVP
jgi:2-oxoglutarate dehydrogenase E1 component